jgi:anti-sigma28 factor (negative regulator of flagellin synthesis)
VKSLYRYLSKLTTPNPEAEQAQQATQESQLAFQASQTAALQGQAVESQARAQKLFTEAQAIPQELEIDRIKAVTTNIREGSGDDREFERRLKVSEQLLKEREVAVKENSVSRPISPSQPPQGMQ